MHQHLLFIRSSIIRSLFSSAQQQKGGSIQLSTSGLIDCSSRANCIHNRALNKQQSQHPSIAISNSRLQPASSCSQSSAVCRRAVIKIAATFKLQISLSPNFATRPALLAPCRRPAHLGSLSQRRSLHSLHKSKLESHSVRLLGIETSCDDTCAAVLDGQGRILSNVKSSQMVQHLQHGGILPSVSYMMHTKVIDAVVLSALREAHIRSVQEIDAVGVTVQPGLTMSLQVGLSYAKEFCRKFARPLIPIHHMEAHALTALIAHRHISFPFLCLLISGGHAQIALFKDLDCIFLLGQTKDIAPGDLLDKIARDLQVRNLGPPFNQICGGDAIERLAKLGQPAYSMLRQHTMSRRNDCNFSFSGLKTATSALIARLQQQRQQPLLVDAPVQEVADVCASLQHWICVHLVHRLARAMRLLESSNLLDADVRSREQVRARQIDYLDELPVRIPLVISGGVACNETITGHIRDACAQMSSYYISSRFECFVPAPKLLCTDNAAMVAWNACLKYAAAMEQAAGTGQHCLHSGTAAFDALGVQHKSPLGIDISDLVLQFNICTPD